MLSRVPGPTERLASAAGGVGLAAVTVAAIGGAGPGAVVAAVGGAALALAALYDAVAVARAPGPAVQLDAPPAASLRRASTLSLTIGPTRGLRAAALRLPFELGGPWLERTALPVRGGARLAISFVPRRRGVHGAGPVWLELEGPLRLVRRRHVAPVAVDVRVGPDVAGPADDVIGRDVHALGAHVGRGLPEAGSELRGLRAFQGGDDPRHVDWKASARHGAPLVREWDPDRRRAVVFCLDAGRLMRAEHDGESKLDAALRALERLALAADAAGDALGVAVYADRLLRFVPPMTGAARGRRLLRFVDDVAPSAAEADLGEAVPHLLGHQARRALVVVVTDVVDRASAERLTAAVVALSARHVPLVALLRDPSLDAALAAPVVDEAAAWRRAAAELVARDRAVALDALRLRGVDALDLDMRGLASGVVASYGRARWRARW